MTRTEDLETRLAERFVERETALALLESGFSHKKIAVILGTHRIYVCAYAQGFPSITAYKRHKAKQRTNPETGQPFTSLRELRDYQARQRINPETGIGFKSETEYGDWLARQRINPETGTKFKSGTEYNHWWARQRGFEGLNEYWSLAADPMVLIVDVLMQAGKPLRIEEIYRKIADSYDIAFSPKRRKIEETIERANHIAVTPIFAEENGMWSLNLGSPAVQELGLEGRATRGVED